MQILINSSDEQIAVPFVNDLGKDDKVIVQPKGRATLTEGSLVDDMWLTDHPQVKLHPAA